MSKRYKISKEEVAEIEKVRKQNKDKNIERRLKALILLGEGNTHEVVASKTGYATGYISKLLQKFRKLGLRHIAGNNYVGNHRNLSLQQEEELLKPFIEKSELGQILEVSEIKQAYEEAIGRKLNSRGHIYDVLKRHGIRKVMPRSKHPNKACDESIKLSKKLTQHTRK